MAIFKPERKIQKERERPVKHRSEARKRPKNRTVEVASLHKKPITNFYKFP